jgi:hypothetical protein
MEREFDEIALDEHNYPTWALDLKICLAFQGLLPALGPPVDREPTFLDSYKFNALFIMRNHLHPDLKAKCVMEEEPHTLWVALRNIYDIRRHSFCSRPTMNGLTYVFRILNLLKTIIMLFIKYVPN